MSAASDFLPEPDSPAAAFAIKAEPEHFQVTELRAEAPSGRGEHLHLYIEKRELTTERAVRILCKALGRRVSHAGIAGRKDKRAVTRQWISIQGARHEDLERLHRTQLKVLGWDYDARKLRRGAHAGNAFEIYLPGFPLEHREKLEAWMANLGERGLVNRFGEQRYGASGRNAAIGSAWWRGDWARGLAEYGAQWLDAQDQAPAEPAEGLGDARTSRSDGLEAWRAWLEQSAPQSELPDLAWPNPIGQLLRKPLPETWLEMAQRVPKAERRFAMQAAQSAWFDHWVDVRAREGALQGPPVPGDCLGLVGQRDQPIASGGEPGFPLGDSPLGPLFGPSMNQSQARAREFERTALHELGLDETMFAKDAEGDPERPRGSRRPLWVSVGDPRVRWEGPHPWLEFRLPPGAYATTLLAALADRWRKDFPLPLR